MPGRRKSEYPPVRYITKIVGSTKGTTCWWAVYKLMDYDEGYSYRGATRAAKECVKSDEAADG